MESPVYSYTLDHDDRLASVCQGWNSFADDNGAAKKIMQPHILNRRIWDFIADGETEYIYSELIARVRNDDIVAKVNIRCDSSVERRFLEIEITNLYDGFVQFDSTVTRVERRGRARLLESDREYSDELLRVCSYCKKIDVGNEDWQEVEIAVNLLSLFDKDPLPRITHGVCPSCYTALMAQLDAFKSRQAAGR